MIDSRKKRQLKVMCVMAFFIICTGCFFRVEVQAKQSGKVGIKTNLKSDKVYRKEKRLKLKIKNKRKGYVIRYTLNGKKPKKTSKIYRKPLKIKKTTVIKAQVFQGGRKISAVKKIKIQLRYRKK